MGTAGATTVGTATGCGPFDTFTITLVFSAHDELHNDAVVLRGDEGLAAHAAEDGLDIHFTDAEDANELAFEVEDLATGERHAIVPGTVAFGRLRPALRWSNRMMW